MKRKYLNIEYKIENLPSELIELIDLYWLLEDDFRFVHSAGTLAKERDITIPKMSKLISGSSCVHVICSNCNSKGEKYSLRSHLPLGEYKENKKIICESCKDKDIKEYGLVNYNGKLEDLKEAYKNRLWEQLETFDLNTLISVAVSTSTSDLYKKVFRGRKMKGRDSYKGWGSLDRLALEKLILIKREQESNKITEFYMLDELKEELEKSYSDLFEEQKNEGHTWDNLSLKIKRNPLKREESHPSYAGEIKFKEDIVLKKGVLYNYSLWPNKDGSLLLKLMPKDET